MTIRTYLVNLLLGTILALFGLLGFIVSVNPDDFVLGKSFGLGIFYLLFLLSAMGLCVLSFTWMYDKMTSGNLSVAELSLAVRQGILVGILLTMFLVLQSFRWFFWWDALLLLGAVFLVELHFLTRE